MATAIEITCEAQAEKIIEEHVESTAGTCVRCLEEDGVAVMVPCFARIEAARYLRRLRG
ncbi:hypothetical protein R8Z50_35040 [Longispora sp. K20-0274]|uniref:hypothetical protein n=1 Tax=Longispora sp. K20-0274 TaxID=3088255 RepID=UPI00399A7844